MVARCTLGLSLSVIVHAVRSTSCQVSGGCVGAWRDFDGNLFHFPEFLLVLRCASATALDVVVSSHSAISAASRRIWTSGESSPASFPTRSTSAFAGDVVVASHAFFLRQIVLSRFAMYFWARSHQDGFAVAANFQWYPSRDWCRIPWVPNHGVQESSLPTSAFHSAFRCTASNHALCLVSDQTLIVFAFTSEPHVFEPC